MRLVPVALIGIGVVSISIGVAGINQSIWSGVLTLGIATLIAGIAAWFFWDDRYY